MNFRVLCTLFASLALVLGCGAGSPDVHDNTPPPTISAFTITPGVITAGDSATITAVFPFGAGAISSGNPDEKLSAASLGSGTSEITVHPTQDTTYTLTVTNAASTTKTVSIQVAPVPTSVITAPTAVTKDDGGGTRVYAASVADQVGCTYEWTLSDGGKIKTGAGTHAITFTGETLGTLTLQCKVTNAAKASIMSADTKLSVVADVLPPAISAPAFVTSGLSGTAAVDSQIGLTYAWSVQGTSTGSALVGGLSGTTVSFTAGAAGRLTLICTITNSAKASTSSTSDISVVEVPGKPSAITLPANVSVGQTGYTASVEPQTGCTYLWSISNGTITAGASTQSITFTAGSDPSKPLTLSCKAINAAGAQGIASDTASTTVVAGPTKPVISSSTTYCTLGVGGYTATVAPQPNCTFGWTLTNGTITSTDQTSNSITFSAGSDKTKPLTLSCKAINAAGVSGAPSETVSIQLVDPPSATISTLVTKVTTSKAGYQASVASQDRCTYAWTLPNSNGVITAGATTPSITFTAGTNSTKTLDLSCTVTNVAGTPALASKSLTVFAAPVISAFSAASPTITSGTGTILNWTVNDPTLSLSLDQGLGDVTGKTSLNNISPTTTTTYTLTATNGATDSVTKPTTITVVPAPGITAFTASPTTLIAGQSATLSATFSGGKAVITPGSLATTSGGSITISPTAPGTITYTLTVINDAGTSKTATAAITMLPGMFTSTGSMSTARTSPSAALLQNGRVLILGGTNKNGTANNAELYVPATGSFVSTGSLNSARRGFRLTPLNTGKVLISGGETLSTSAYVSVANSDVYDPATGAFSATGSLIKARTGHTATLLSNGLVLIAGGQGPSADTGASAELYDPSTGSFSATGSLNTARAGHTATLLPNGKVLITGGTNGSTGAIGVAEVYDPSTKSFTNTGSLVTARNYPVATLLSNGKVLIVGGSTGSTYPLTYLTSAELYDPASGTFSTTGSVITKRLITTATLLSKGKVLIAGGWDGVSAYLDSAEVYDPATGLFSPTGRLTTPRSDYSATLLPSGKVLIAGGGAYSTAVFALAELYDPQDASPSLAAPAEVPVEDALE